MQVARNALADVALGYARREAVRARWIRGLCEFIAIPSVSSAPDCAPLKRCAAWLAARLREVGLSSARVVDGRFPAVVARYDGAPGKPSLLTYGHYDVQPAGSGWRSDPFRPYICRGAIYGRGASDDKGQLFMHLAALEAVFATERAPRLNVRMWCEGEEEIGSPGASRFLGRHLAELRADVAIVSDTEMPAKGRPALIYGLRGSVSLDVTVHGPRRAVHSGRYGGAVVNPLEALAGLVASLHDAQQRVAVDGFYAAVRDVGITERKALADAASAGAAGRPSRELPAVTAGEPGYSAYERTTIRPALVVTCLRGGDDSASIPAAAHARLTARLVPDQDPLRVANAIHAHLAARTPPGVRCAVTVRGASRAVRLPADAWAMRLAARVLQATYGVKPVLLRSGGSIPIVGQLHRRMGAPVVVMGFGLPDDAIHGPNERFTLDAFFAGIEALIRFYTEFAR